jgi:hypothetical protein
MQVRSSPEILAVQVGRSGREANSMSLLLHCCMKTSPNTVRERKPEVYLASVVSLLPKQSQIEKRSRFDDLTDAELDQLEEYIAGMRAKTVAQLELVANNEEAAVQLSAEEKDATQPIHEAK